MSDYDKEIEVDFDMSIDNNKLLQEAYEKAVEYVDFNKKNLLTNGDTEIDFKVGYSMGYRSGAKWQKEKDAERIISEKSEDKVMRWLHKNYLESYDKCTSSYHRMIAKDLLKELKEASEG
jgi:hypothetical protein